MFIGDLTEVIKPKETLAAEYEGWKVFMVKGKPLRKKDTKFIGGDNPAADTLDVPKKTVWIEHMLDQEDEDCFLVHELIEYYFIEFCKQKYEDAHKKANEGENRVRNGETPEKVYTAMIDDEDFRDIAIGLSKQFASREKRVEEGVVKESYTTGLAHFLEYLNAGMDAYDFSHMLEEFFSDTGVEPPETFDSDEPYEFLETPEFAEVKDDFIEWLKQNVRANTPELPTYIFMENGKIMPRQTWLVHFSPNAKDVARDGFKYGGEDFREIGLTATLSDKNRKASPGWNFAFDALGDKIKVRSYAYGEQYGKDFVVFQSAGVKAFHNTDYENQVVFWGPGVKERYLVIGDRRNKRWDVMKGDKVAYAAPDPDDAVAWIVKNHSQYRKVITNNTRQEPIQPTPKKDREALLAKQPEPRIKSMVEADNEPEWGTSGGRFITPKHKKAKKSYQIYKSIPTDPPQAVQVAQVGEAEELERPERKPEVMKPGPNSSLREPKPPALSTPVSKMKITRASYKDVMASGLFNAGDVLKIEKPKWISIDRVIETEHKNRKPEGQAKAWAIANSIEDEHTIPALWVNVKDQSLLDGHHRLEAMRKKGWKLIPVQYLHLRNL